MFSVENKTSTCFRGNDNEILLKCVLISFNKITSSEGLTFFFEIWGFDQRLLTSVVSTTRRERLQELKLLLCGAGLWLEKLNFLQQRPFYLTVQGWRWNQRQDAERKPGCISEDLIVLAFGLSARGFEGTVSAPAHLWGTPIRQTTRLVPSLWPLTLASLPTFPFLFFIFVPNSMFLFSSLIKYGFLCCVVDFPPPHTDLTQVSPLT